MKVISRFAPLIVVVALVYLLLSDNLLSLSPFVIAVQLGAIALSIWARSVFQPDQFSIHAEAKKGQLLAKGPYKYIRHPMYTSALLLIWSGILSHLSPINIAIGVIVTGVVAVRIIVEEQSLSACYPEYAGYALSTKRIIPMLI